VAIARYHAALALDPRLGLDTIHVEVYMCLAKLLLSLWGREKALPHFRKLGRDESNDTSIHDNVAVTLARFNLENGARAHLKLSARMFQNLI